MSFINSIQLKAAFLLVVFALNTAAGFACSIGFDMGFNKSHHDEKEIIQSTVHVHADGKKHDHHDQATKNLQKEKKNSNKEKDGCCTDEMMKLQTLDKNLNQNTSALINAPALMAIFSVFLNIDIFKAPEVPQLHTLRYLFPPPPNILTAIQKFQI
jgi:hypothetical protein